jgi:hypothetical protein
LAVDLGAFFIATTAARSETWRARGDAVPGLFDDRRAEMRLRARTPVVPLAAKAF